MSYHVLFLIFVLNTLTFQAYCECHLPPDLDGAWWDSSAGNVLFTQTTKQLDGWLFTVYSQTLSEFTCVESVDNILLFKSNNEANTFGELYYGFLCMVYTNLTSSSFKYYLQADEEPDEASRQRIKMVLKENALEPYDINSICNPVNGPSPQEYHVLVKQDRFGLLFSL